MFEVNNENITTSDVVWYFYCWLWTYFTPFFSVSIVGLVEHVNVSWNLVGSGKINISPFDFPHWCSFIKETHFFNCNQKSSLKYDVSLKNAFVDVWICILPFQSNFVEELMLTSHGILHYLWSADQSKSFSQLIASVFTFFQYLDIFQ